MCPFRSTITRFLALLFATAQQNHCCQEGVLHPLPLMCFVYFFSFTWDHMGVTNTIFTPQNSCIPIGRASTKVIKEL